MSKKLSLGKLIICLAVFWQSPLLATSNTVEQIIQIEAAEKGVPVKLIKAVIETESSNNRYAVSPVGAMGLMQLMPDTAKRFNVSNVFDPKQNIRAGVSYLSLLKRQFGTWALALAAYNAGERKIEKYGGIPPYKETQDYVVKILEQYNPKLIPASLHNHKIKTQKAKRQTQQNDHKQPTDIYASPLFFDVEL